MKQNKQNKVLAILLAIMMTMTMLPSIVLAQGADPNMSGNCGATQEDHITWELKQNNEDSYNPTYTLIISGEGAMADYASQGEVPWGAYLDSQITEGIVEDGITHLGARTFVLAKKLEHVSLPQSLISIGESAFNQSSLTEITLPENLREIGKNAFWKGSLAKEIKIPESVTVIGDHAFNGTQINKVTLPAGLLSLGTGAFQGSQLTQMPEIPSSITTLTTTFQNCKNITEITIPSHVSVLDRTFMGCTALTEITIPETVESYIGAFNGCTGLTKAVIESKADNIGGDNTNNAWGVFGGCINLKTVSVPEWVKVIGIAAFRDCSSLETTDFIERATVIKSQAFQNCTALKGSLRLDAVTIDALAFENCSNLGPHISVANAEKMPSDAFRGCDGVNGIVYAQMISGGANEFDSRAVTALLNGGTFKEGTDLNIATLATPIKRDYRFEGWFTQDGTNDIWGDQINIPESGKTYYAKWIEKTDTAISFKDSLQLDKTYDKLPISLSSADYTVTAGAGTVDFRYQMKDKDTWQEMDTAPINAETYRVKAVVLENDTHKSAQTDWLTFSIEKAEPFYYVPNDLSAYVGTKLADIALPEGFAWKDGDMQIGGIGEKQYIAIYTPEDQVNYKCVEVAIKINVKAQSEVSDDTHAQLPTDKNEDTNTGIQTGDNSHVYTWGMMAILSALFISGAFVMKQRKNDR